MCLGADCSSIHLASTQYHLWTLDFHQIPLHHWSALHAEQQCITGKDKYFDLGKLLLGLIITLTSTVLNLFSFKGKETLRSQGRPFNCLDKKKILSLIEKPNFILTLFLQYLELPKILYLKNLLRILTSLSSFLHFNAVTISW